MASEACILRQLHEVNLRWNNDRLQEPFSICTGQGGPDGDDQPQLWSTLSPIC
jgi:hypothetical protein